MRAHRILLCGVAPLRSTSTQKDTEKIQIDHDKKNSVSFCVFAITWALFFIFFHETFDIIFKTVLTKVPV